ncbi:MAG: LysM peptidoglycan-binding domain-containing protein [Pseudomonadota bacterium]
MMSSKGVSSVIKALFLALAMTLSPAGITSDDSPLKPDAPDRYVVKKGDTLWGLANRFLKDPWRWPLIWINNDQIENPHLIFPGDLLVVTGANNIKVVRLKPKVRREALDDAIPTIPPNVIQPFLTNPLIVDEGELEAAGHVVIGVEDELVLGKLNQFYARNLSDITANNYRIFSIGDTLRHPESNELLGIEAVHLGDARMVRADEDVSKLLVISSNQEIAPGDRMVPVYDEPPLPFFQPRVAETPIDGWILHAPKGVREVGRYDVVILSAGAREGVKEGHVFNAMYHRGVRSDPVDGSSYKLPDEISGVMMVFRVFDKLSYALVMEATRAISVGDRFETPE